MGGPAIVECSLRQSAPQAISRLMLLEMKNDTKISNVDGSKSRMGKRMTYV